MTPTAHASAIPPAFAERLLRASVRDAEWRDAVSGDLREEYATLVARRGPAAAARWYWRQALPLAARFTAGRVVPAITPPRRRRVAVADIERTSSLGSGWSRELRHAWRGLWQRPALSATIVCTLALALAANAVVFNLADALYLRPLRFPDVDRLIVVASDAIGEKPYLDRESVTPADFRDWRQSITTATGLAAVEWWDPNLSGVDIPEQVAGFRVTPGFFETLGVAPILGRTFGDAQARPGADRAVVLSHAFWTRRFNADPSLLGQTIRLDGAPYEVVGVMPPRFVLPYGADVWAPLAYSDEKWADRKSDSLMTFARLVPGRTLADAQEEWRAVVARQAAEFPETNKNRPVTVLSLTRGLGDDAIGPFLVDLAGGGGPGTAHRLRQHRQPAAGARHRAAARVRRAPCARRRTRPPGAAAPARGSVPRRARRRAGRGARRRRDADHARTSCRPMSSASCPAMSTSTSTAWCSR